MNAIRPTAKTTRAEIEPSRSAVGWDAQVSDSVVRGQCELRDGCKGERADPSDLRAGHQAQDNPIPVMPETLRTTGRKPPTR